MSTNKNIAIIGAGIAGVEAASTLADMGYSLYLIEKEKTIGGNIKNWNHLFPTNRDASELREYLQEKIKHPKINVFIETEIKDFKKENGKLIITTNKHITLEVSALLITTGFQPFDASRKEEYGYGVYENVITSVDLEQIFKDGKTLFPDGKTPSRIAFVHCVGSRDAKSGNTYCSKVCCITGIKQAIEMNKLYPQTEMYSFYMDLRMHGLEYERYYKSAQENYNTQFIRGRVSEVSENKDKSIQLKAEDTLSGLPLKMKVDLLVLLVGMEAQSSTQILCKKMKLESTPERFFQPKDRHLEINLTQEEGIFLAGTCIAPMTIDETIQNSRSAALEIDRYLHSKNKVRE